MAADLDDVVIGGVGESPVGEVPDLDPMTLAAVAARQAMADAGVTNADIDGLWTVDSVAEPYRMHSVVLAEHLGIKTRSSMTCSLGGAVHVAMVLNARDIIRAGRAQAILIVSAERLKTGMTKEAALTSMAQGAGHPDLERPFAPIIVGLYAMAMRLHMAKFGTTAEQLAQIAVTHRAHGALNPAAQLRLPVTVDEVLASRLIADPIHKDECSLVSDGAGAVLVMRAPASGSRGRSPAILGGAEYHSHEHVSEAASLIETGARETGRAAFAEAGVAPDEIDVACLYDSFTITVLLLLEQLGFCGDGEGGAFVEDGGIDIGGRLPVNPHGGLISHCHPGRPGGIFHIVEAVRQLRQEAGDRQVPNNPQLGVAHGSGGVLSTHSTVILGR